MSMADDHTFRSYRSNDPYRRAEPARSSDQTGASDPLAELARLIGQSDPLAEFGRQSRPAQHAGDPRDDYGAPAHDDWQRDGHFAADRGRAAGREEYRDYAYAAQPPRADDRRYENDPHDAYHDEADQHGRHYADYGHQQADYGHQQAGYGQHQADYGQHHADDHGYDDAHHAAQADEGYFHDDVPLEPHEDETYDDAPRRRHHNGLATALALIGCAMLGTAGAYAYRSYYPGASGPVPVITADSSTPIKVVPAAADPSSGKPVQDRLATAGKEQVITKQEEPVALKDLGAPPAPRVVLPAPVAPTPAAPPAAAVAPPSPPAAAAAAPRAVAAPPPGGIDSKPVATVRIRPDGADVSGRPVSVPPPTAQPPATVRSATPPAPKAAPAPSGSGPLSLQPQSDATPPPPAAAARTRAAAVAPAETTSTTGGGHVVQLSSQKTEGEAQAVFRALQAKFPSELGDRQPIIRRADLGGKGVVYRTQVGPFSSAAEASKFCASYKAAGGQCFVP